MKVFNHLYGLQIFYETKGQKIKISWPGRMQISLEFVSFKSGWGLAQGQQLFKVEAFYTTQDLNGKSWQHKLADLFTRPVAFKIALVKLDFLFSP